MGVTVEFTLPPEEFVLAWAVPSVPEIQVEIERVVFDSLQTVTPYFWVGTADFEAFDDALADDPTVEDIHVLEEEDGERLYRATWRKNVRGILLAFSDELATILKATWTGEAWKLSVLFADQESLSSFEHYCATYNLSLELTRLRDATHFLGDEDYGLTAKQRDALVTALEKGYFEVPRECSLAAVASEMDISKNAASTRLRRGSAQLIRNTLAHEPTPE